MLRIAVNTQINRPVQEVWEFFIDLTNSPIGPRVAASCARHRLDPLGWA